MQIRWTPGLIRAEMTPPGYEGMVRKGQAGRRPLTCCGHDAADRPLTPRRRGPAGPLRRRGPRLAAHPAPQRLDRRARWTADTLRDHEGRLCDADRRRVAPRPGRAGGVGGPHL